MTMELGSEFSLGQAFRWEDPIGESAQLSIAAYGSDEDRLLLVDHFSVTILSLETMAIVPSEEVRMAVAGHPNTPLEPLMKLTHDPSRFVRSVAKRAVADLPARQRANAKALDESPLQRLRSRISA